MTSYKRVTRRHVLEGLTGLSIGSVAFRRALAAQVATQGSVTAEMIRQAEWIAGLELTEEEREQTAARLRGVLRRFEALRQVDVGYEVPPALFFFPAPTRPTAEVHRGRARPMKGPPSPKPTSDDDLAFRTVVELGSLLRTRQVSSVELTKLYLDRLQRYNGSLRCVVSFTDDLALRQAKQADREIGSGNYRGPLHGIPWGAKDLIAYPGYKTTWGAPPFQDQELSVKATVAERLDEAGAVLIAKLSLGALAQGDKWFGGMTRNPWNVEEGSSGSSAGSASATAAGLVGFALGSETLGSIVSPCRRCGCSGLRPTYGRVSRYGCMALSWSMDKIGPICRGIEDCALVLDAIHGRDGLDPTAVDHAFHWPPQRDLRSLRVGYFERPDAPIDKRPELQVLRQLGVELVPIQLPSQFPARAVAIILNTEAAAVFDDLTRNNITEGLNSWPGAFRQGQFVPAVEYLRANRIRTLLIGAMEKLMQQVDVYVGGNDSVITNLTGHPTVVLPHDFIQRRKKRVPGSLKFTGRLFGESELLAVASAYQRATGFHYERPDLSVLG